MAWHPASQRVLLALAAALFLLGVVLGARSARTPLWAPLADDPALEMRLDLNLATAAELESLPGIGPALAGRIVSFREKHGAFGCAEDIGRVPGIGTKLAAALGPYLTATPP